MENPEFYLSLVNKALSKKGLPTVFISNSDLLDSRKLYHTKNPVLASHTQSTISPTNNASIPTSPVNSSPPFPQPHSYEPPSANIQLPSNLAITPINKSPLTPQTQSVNPSTHSTHPPFQPITSDSSIVTLHLNLPPSNPITLYPSISIQLSLHTQHSSSSINPSPQIHLLPIQSRNSDK